MTHRAAPSFAKALALSHWKNVPDFDDVPIFLGGSDSGSGGPDESTDDQEGHFQRSSSCSEADTVTINSELDLSENSDLHPNQEEETFKHSSTVVRFCPSPPQVVLFKGPFYIKGGES